MIRANAHRYSTLALAGAALLVASAPAVADDPSFEGTWSTTFGDVVMTQEGRTVEGRYEQPRGSTLSGEIEGRVLKGTWRQSDGNGTFEFELAEDGRSFEGSYTFRLETGDWNGTLTSRPAPREETPEPSSSGGPATYLEDVELTDSQAALAKELMAAFVEVGPVLGPPGEAKAMTDRPEALARLRSAFDAAAASGIPDHTILTHGDGSPGLAVMYVRFWLPVLEGTVTEAEATRPHAAASLALNDVVFQGKRVIQDMRLEGAGQDFTDVAEAAFAFNTFGQETYARIMNDINPKGMMTELGRNLTLALRNDDGSTTLVSREDPSFHGVIRDRQMQCNYRKGFDEFVRFVGTMRDAPASTSEPAQPVGPGPDQPEPPTAVELTPEQLKASQEHEKDFARVVDYVRSLEFTREKFYDGDPARFLRYLNSGESSTPDLNAAGAAVPRARTILTALDDGLAYVRHENLRGEVTTYDAAGARALCESALRFGSLAIHAGDLANKAFSVSNWKKQLDGGAREQAQAMVAQTFAQECLDALAQIETLPIASLVQVTVDGQPMNFNQIRDLAVSVSRQAGGILAEIDAAYRAQRAPFLAALSGDRLRVFEEVFGLELKCYGPGGNVLQTPEEYASAEFWATVGYPPGIVPLWCMDVYRWDGMALEKMEKMDGIGPFPASAEFR